VGEFLSAQVVNIISLFPDKCNHFESEKSEKELWPILCFFSHSGENPHFPSHRAGFRTEND
jgi:hypothetical protein